jgi:hypothetical protein
VRLHGEREKEKRETRESGERGEEENRERELHREMKNASEKESTFSVRTESAE